MLVMHVHDASSQLGGPIMSFCRRSLAEITSTVAQAHACGSRGRDFAKHHNLAEASSTRWLRAAPAPAESAPILFVAPAPGTSPAWFELALPDEHTQIIRQAGRFKAHGDRPAPALGPHARVALRSPRSPKDPALGEQRLLVAGQAAGEWDALLV
jgi:hypothetical protein